MHRLLAAILIFFSVATWAEAVTGEMQVQLQAENISGDSRHLYAKGHIVLKYKKTLFLADLAEYDKRHKRLTVEGSVRIINPDGSRVQTQKVTLNIPEKRVVFQKFFYADKENTWLSSATAEKKKQCYQLKEAMFSTCAVSNPDWHLGFSEADYNATSKYMTLKDIKFYAGDTPIFYFPYLAFSTSRERSSGLLMPRLGYNTKEGFVYEQPIYWAIDESMDLEFNPQIRSNRSLGLYATLRFADSNHSEGLMRAGYFADDEEYTSQYNLKNDSHYGLEGKYESSDVLGKQKPEGYQDALYANMVLFNDIDYLNLQKKNLPHLSDSHLKESRLNYMLYGQEHYFGLNAKYFLDANKESNRETLQELPSLRWHKYSSSFGFGNFSYSMDAKLSHFVREKGNQSGQLEWVLPVSYHFSLLDDYLKVSLSEELYAFAGNFDFNGTERVGYQTLVATHKIKLSSDLLKPYQYGTHTIEWSAEYARQNYLGDGLVTYNTLDRSLRRDFLSREPFDDRVTLALSQYWHNNTQSLSAKQRISQEYYPDRDKKWGDLRHELMLEYGNWRISNLLEYSFRYQGLSEMSNKLQYHTKQFAVDMEHFWRKDVELHKVLTNEIALHAHYQYNDTLKLFGSMTYDLEEKHSKKWRSGFRYDKGCWAVELSYEHDTKPILGATGGASLSSDAFRVKVSLVPFGESEISQ